MLRRLLSILLIMLPFVTVILPGSYAVGATHANTPGATLTPGRALTTADWQNGVFTQHNDPARTGANLNESILNTSNVNPGGFGKLFSRYVDGYIYAQPLYAPAVSTQSGVRNLVFVATEHDSVFAFDADDARAFDPVWNVSFGNSVPSTDIASNYRDLYPEIGITGTPVIDSTTGTLYVVAKTKDDSGYHQRLHALDIGTGNEKLGGPVEISASVAGAGDGNINGVINFDPLLQLNRPALLLANGEVYIAFGSHGDNDPYHGWVLGYDASSLQQKSVFCTTPDGGRGSIWQSGQGLLADQSGDICLMTANGTCDTMDNCGRNLGESFVKLSPDLSAVDWFTPDNRLALDQEDMDVGSGGPILVPGTTLMVGGGKDGVLRVVDTEDMGKFNPDTDQDVQEFPLTAKQYLGSPVFWNSPTTGPTLYAWGGSDSLKAFSLSDGVFNPTPVMTGANQVTDGLSNSPPLTLSAKGSTAGTGIVWAVCPEFGDANPSAVSGAVYAYDASDLSKKLWDSTMIADRDDSGLFAKFCPPTVVNGKVYVASFSGMLNVYGLLPSPCAVAVSSTSLSFPAGGGPGTLSVFDGSDCAWTAISASDFISIQSGNGNGTDIVAFTVASNDGPVRTGGINIQGQTVLVTQNSGCQYSLAASQTTFKHGGGTGTINVNSNSGCSWGASSGVAWISIVSGASGAGSGTTTFSVAPNTKKAARTGTVSIGSQTITFLQNGKKE